jgi:hypothetical protein
MDSFLFRNQERCGNTRTTTAYEFYQAALEHCQFEVVKYRNLYEKPTFEATDYLTWYAASDENDAKDKDCAYVLNRQSCKWYCSDLAGSSTKYEFTCLTAKDDGDYNSSIYMRSLPCSCKSCVSCLFDKCTNKDIAGERSLNHIRRLAEDEYLTEITEEGLDSKVYTIKQLVFYITEHRIPYESKNRNKDVYSAMIRKHLRSLDPDEDDE